MKKYFAQAVFFVSFFGLGIVVQAQSPALAPPVLPPAPNAAALGQFGDVPVSLYTGTPTIDVPLYTIHTSHHTLPISLSYHGGGVRVDEEASWVGLGWNLNAGGVITRSMRGKDDFFGLGWGYAAPNAHPLPACDPANMYNGTAPGDLDYFCDGTQDSQPDVFYYNFQGHAGKFYMDQGSSFRTRVATKEDNLLITTTNGLSWKITTPDGYIYSFGKTEITHPIYKSVSATYSSAGVTQTSQSEQEYISSWYLTTITAPNGEQVNLEYETSSQLSYPLRNQSFRTGLIVDYGGTLPGKVDDWTSTVSRAYLHVTSPILSKISYKNGEIDFITDSRTDMVESIYGGPGGPKRIKGINIFSVNATHKKIIKQYDFIANYGGGLI